MTDLNITISDLRTRITFQAPTVVTDAGGAQSETYADVTESPSVWSQWVYDHGQEAVQADAARVEQRATVTIRQRADVNATWRILKGAEIWKIIAPPEFVQERRRWVVLRVERVKGTV